MGPGGEGRFHPRAHSEQFARAVEEGERRLDQSLIELVSTGFIAGFTIVFGIVGYGMVAAIVEDSRSMRSLARLWVVTLVFDLVGGSLFAVVFSVEGVLSSGAATALHGAATESMARGAMTWFASAIVGGALVSLLSFLLVAVNGVRSRNTLAYITGVLLAVGPFDHVIVTALHVFVGVLFGASVGYGAFGGCWSS